MRMFAVITLFAILSTNAVVARVMWGGKHIEDFKNEIKAATDLFATSKSTLEELRKKLPGDPKAKGDEEFAFWQIEGDVFYMEKEQNSLAIRVLEEQIESLRLRLQELKKVLKSQKQFDKTWKESVKKREKARI